MRKLAAIGVAGAAGLGLAWTLTLIGAELIRSTLGPHFAETVWPLWFPATPMLIATAGLAVVIGRMLYRWTRPIHQRSEN